MFLTMAVCFALSYALMEWKENLEEDNSDYVGLVALIPALLVATLNCVLMYIGVYQTAVFRKLRKFCTLSLFSPLFTPVFGKFI